ncbi:MAG: nucleotidyltransferase domain-containing protein [Desulfosalsimonadaceae bacterium]
MTDAVFQKIQNQLDHIEETEDVRIIYACESGSRAWGFASEDSDYDVRFIYVRKTAWYLSLRKRRDVIEKPISDSLDISGWDVFKALSLLAKSNPPLLEWLQSPIVYRKNDGILVKIRGLMPDYYSPKSCMHHYLHMAQGNYRQYLQGDTVWVKKYFYVLRPVLACRWIESGYGIVPTEFDILVKKTIQDETLKKAVASLMDRKKAGNELDMGRRIPVISDFLDHELQRLSDGKERTAISKNFETLDRVFLDILHEVNGKPHQA